MPYIFFGDSFIYSVHRAMNDSWCMTVGFPSIGFFANNRREFGNIKLDELKSKHGLTVRFGQSYSPWSKGFIEQNCQDHCLASFQQ